MGILIYKFREHNQIAGIFRLVYLLIERTYSCGLGKFYSVH